MHGVTGDDAEVENPGKMLRAPQCEHRALQVSLDSISARVAAADRAGQFARQRICCIWGRPDRTATTMRQPQQWCPFKKYRPRAQQIMKYVHMTLAYRRCMRKFEPLFCPACARLLPGRTRKKRCNLGLIRKCRKVSQGYWI